MESKESGLWREARESASNLAALLERTGTTIALAESCTGGLVGYLLTAVPGISRFFLQGFVTYSNASKTSMLGVDAALIEDRGAVSREVAEAMARGAARASGAAMAISVTGVAGPSGGASEKPVGLVWIAVSCNGEVAASCREFGTLGREEIRLLSAAAALGEASELLARAFRHPEAPE